MKRLLWLSPVGVLLLPLLACVLLLVTESGSRWVLEAAGRMLALEMEYERGTLAGQLEIRRFAWADEDLSVELNGIVLELSPTCLWYSSICFQQLSARELHIVVFDDSESAAVTEGDIAEETDDETLLEFPVPMSAAALRLDSLRVTWAGGEWSQDSLLAAVDINGSTIDVSRATIQGAKLTLVDSNESEEPFELFDISLPLDLRVADLALTRGVWDLYGQPGELQSLSLTGGWLRKALNLEGIQLQSAAAGRWQASGNILFSGQWPVAASGTADLPEAPDWPQQLQRHIAFSVDGELNALTVRADLAGDYAVTASAVLDVVDSQLPFQLQAAVDWPGELALSEWLELPAALEPVTLTSPLRLEAGGNLQAQDFQLQASGDVPSYPALALQFAGSHRDGRLLVDDLRLRDAGGDNTLWASGDLDYSNALTVSALLESSGLDLPMPEDYGPGSVAGQLRFLATLDGEQWEVAVSEVDIMGEVDAMPVRVSGYAGLDSQWRLLASDLQAHANNSRLLLRATGNASGNSRAELTVGELGAWLPGAAGKLSLQVLGSPDWEQFTVSGSAEYVHWQALRFDSAEVSGNYQAATGERFKLDVRLQDLAVADIALGNSALTAAGDRVDQTVSLRTGGDIAGTLELSGQLEGDGSWRGQLAATKVQTGEGIWHLQEPVAVHLELSRPQARLQAHCWHFRDSRVCPGELLLGEEGSASASLAGNLAELSELLPADLELSGTLTAAVTASWASGQPLLLDGSARGREIVFTRHYADGESGSVSWDKLDVDVSSGVDGVSLAAALYHAGKRVSGIDLQLPADRQRPLSGRVDIAALQLAMLAPLAPTMSSLQGELRGSLQLHGTVDKPLAEGSLQLSGGLFSLLENPTELASVELQLEARGDRAVLKGGGLLGGGALTFDGELLSEPEWTLQLAVAGDNHEILLPPYTRMKVSEKLTLQLSSGQLELKGDIVVHEGLLEHEQLPAGSIDLSDDVVEVDYSGKILHETAPFDARINVSVFIHDKFRVLGEMVDTTLGGDLKLLQNPRQPLQVFGNLNVIGGELRAYQQRLRIRRGTIAFAGTPDNPELNVRAQREISGENIVVGLYLSGTLKQPKLEVFSDPVLPDEQAMSYLVRGRGIDAGAGADGVAMALSVGTGLVNQTALVTELNRIPGISGLEFGTEGSTEDDTAATVGGYIGSRLYLSYGLGIYEPINVLTARLYLQTRLWLEVVSRLENSVDLYYSFDIK